MKKTLSRQVLESRYSMAKAFNFAISLDQIRPTVDVNSFIIRHQDLKLNDSKTELIFK